MITLSFPTQQEKILYKAKISKVHLIVHSIISIFLAVFIWVIAGNFFYGLSSKIGMYIVFLIEIPVFIICMIRVFKTNLYITNKKVLYQKGLINVVEPNILLDKISSVSIRYSFFR